MPRSGEGSWICTCICVYLHGAVDFTLFMFRLIGTMFCGLDGEGVYGVRWLEILSQILEVDMNFRQEALRINSKVEISRTTRPITESYSKVV